MYNATCATSTLQHCDRVGLIRIRYRCFHMFLYLYVLFVLTYFRFPIKLYTAWSPRNTYRYIIYRRWMIDLILMMIDRRGIHLLSHSHTGYSHLYIDIQEMIFQAFFTTIFSLNSTYFIRVLILFSEIWILKYTYLKTLFLNSWYFFLHDF